VKTQNFTEAAERLYLTQSTVSKNISALEKELGFLLFERRGHSMVLTPEGQQLLKNFSEIVVAYERMEETVEFIRKTGHLPGETVRIFMIPIVGRFGLISTINHFSAVNPGFNPSIEIMDEIQVVLALQAGGCDVAFCSNIMLDDRLYDMEKYITGKFKLVVAKDSPLARKKSMHLKDLEGEKLILKHLDSLLWGICVHACEDAGFYPNIALSTNRPDIALEYLRSSDCVYMTIDIEAKDYTPDIYSVIDLKDSPEFDFVFAWRKASGLPQIAREYIDYAYMNRKGLI